MTMNNKKSGSKIPLIFQKSWVNWTILLAITLGLVLFWQEVYKRPVELGFRLENEVKRPVIVVKELNNGQKQIQNKTNGYQIIVPKSFEIETDKDFLALKEFGKSQKVDAEITDGLVVSIAAQEYFIDFFEDIKQKYGQRPSYYNLINGFEVYRHVGKVQYGEDEPIVIEDSIVDSFYIKRLPNQYIVFTCSSVGSQHAKFSEECIGLLKEQFIFLQ